MRFSPGTMSGPANSSGKTHLMNHQRRRIVQVIRALDVGKGGAERVFIETANLLSRHGHDVTCLYYGGSFDRHRIKLDPAVALVNLADGGGRASVPVLKTRRFRRFARDVYQKVSRVSPLRPVLWNLTHGRFKRALEVYFDAERPDVAISYLPSANTPVLLAAQGRSVRVICTNHNRPEADYTDPSRWDPNPLDRRLRLRVLDRADAIHVLFKDFVAWFPERLREKIVVVPNFVSPEIIAAARSPRRDNLIIAVGRLAPVKQIETLIEAWAKIAPRHPGWRVALYGDGPDAGRLQDLARRRDLTETVQFHSFTDDIAEVYSRASILCHPALHEGFGLAVAESLTCGVPVIAFADCTGVNKLVRNGENGLLVEREDGVEGLANALDSLITDEDLRQTLGHNGPASVRMYSVDAFTRRWTDLIERVCQ